MSRNLQAGEVGRLFKATNLGYDWNGNGHTAKLHVTFQGTTNTYNMSTVNGQAQQAKVLTTATMFPSEGQYRCQVVTYIGTDPQLRSVMKTVVVLGSE